VLNVKSVDLAGYLNEIFNGVSYSPSSDTGGSVAPGLTPIEAGGSRMNTNARNNGNAANRTQQRQQRNTGTARRSSAGGIPSDGGPRITSVDENNQLLVLSTPAQWAIIQQAAKRLDIAPLQVQVE